VTDEVTIETYSKSYVAPNITVELTTSDGGHGRGTARTEAGAKALALEAVAGAGAAAPTPAPPPKAHRRGSSKADSG
jgi:hypothetical protein